MLEVIYNHASNEWQARVTRDGRMYVGVGATKEQAVKAAHRKANVDR